MLRPEFSVALRWTRPSGQNVLGVERIGAWLREPEGWRRLPETLFAVAQAVGDYAAVPPGDEAEAASRTRRAERSTAARGDRRHGGRQRDAGHSDHP